MARRADDSASAPAASPSAAVTARELAGYEVVVAVCGGIAAYKVAQAVSALVQKGAGVTVAMTDAAQRFITPLTFQALTAREVFTDLWQSERSFDPQHLSLTETADLFIVAPATANVIAAAAAGLAHDLVSTMLLSVAGPVLLAPAMNTRMWQNALVQRNLKTLLDHGFLMVPPGEGWLACRTIGAGRMAEADQIVSEAVALLKRSAPKRNA